MNTLPASFGPHNANAPVIARSEPVANVIAACGEDCVYVPKTVESQSALGALAELMAEAELSLDYRPGFRRAIANAHVALCGSPA